MEKNGAEFLKSIAGHACYLLRGDSSLEFSKKEINLVASFLIHRHQVIFIFRFIAFILLYVFNSF